MDTVKVRQRRRVPFEPLMITPDQINAFFGIDLEDEMTRMNLDVDKTSQQSNNPESTATNFEVTDNQLWRTMNPASVNSQTHVEETITIAIHEQSNKRESATINFEVTDNPLWRTMNPIAGDSQASVDEDESEVTCTSSNKRESTTINFEVTDNPLWRTRVSDSQKTAVIETNTTQTSTGKRESTSINFEVTDNPLWRTRVSDSQKTMVVEEIETNKRESATINFEVTDHSLWRTRVSDSQKTMVVVESAETITHHEQIERPASATINFEVTDNQLWRTRISNLHSTMASDQSDAEVTRTQIDKRKSATINFEVTDNPMWRTMNPITEDSQTVTMGQGVEENTIHGQSGKRGSVATNFNATENQFCRTANPTVEDSQIETTANISEVMETPKRSTPLKQVTPLSAHYAEPTHASSAKAKQAAGGTPTCGRSVECSSPALTFAEQRARRQSVEAFTQTSVNGNKNRRQTVLKLMHDNSPGFPRRSVFIPPFGLKHRPLPEMAPFFNRLSTGSTTSDGSGRPSTGTNTPVALRNRVLNSNLAKKIGETTPTTEKTPIKAKTPIKEKKDNETTMSTPTQSKFFNSLISNMEAKSGVVPAKHPALASNAKPRKLFDIGYPFNDTTADFFNNDDEPLSQQIPSQQPVIAVKKPFSLLNDDDFTFGSPALHPIHRRLSARNLSQDEKPTCSASIPNKSRFHSANDTLMEINDTMARMNFDETAGVSMISGSSDRDSDMNSPAPKHIVLRAKPKEKTSPFMFVKPPKIVQGTDEFAEEHNQLRRSKRNRFQRPLTLGEKPIYERDENGDLNLVGASKGYTADTLCKKYKTFDKDIAMDMQKQESRRKKRIRQQNKEQRQVLAEKYAQSP